MGQTERERWHGKVASYPGDILVGPGRFHEGPDFIQIEEGGRYRWGYVELAEAASGAGRWSLVGPLKARKDFRNHDASSNGDKGRRRRGCGMSEGFVLRHETATTEKALGAAARVEVIVGKVMNRAKRAMSELDLEDLALLVQHVRDVSAGPRLEHTWTVAELLARAEAAEQRAGAASAEVEEWRAFAAEVVRVVRPGATGEILANHLSVEDLPDVRTALRAALGGDQ